MKIDLKKTCGKKTITRQDGEVINKMILSAWNKEEHITIDFSNILIASVSFLDEAFGKLTFEYDKNVLGKKLTFKNMAEYDSALLNDIILSCYHQRELGQNGLSRRTRKRNTDRNLLRQE